MELFIKLSAAAVCAALLSLTIKKDVPQLAMLLSLSAGIIILIAVLSEMSGIMEEISGIVSSAGLNTDIFLPMLKLLGISVVTKVSCAVCRDCGSSALAAKIELSSAAVSAVIIMPMLAAVLKTINSIGTG